MKEKALPKPLFLWPDEAVPMRKFRSRIERVIPDESPITLITGVNYPAPIPYPAKGAKKPCPAVIVCPGGAYDVLALDYEGLEIAEYLAKHGVAAFVLKYRVPRQREAALCDAVRAVRYLRYYADKFGIRKDSIGIMGFSAGGHLSAFTAGSCRKKLYAPTDDIDKESARPATFLLQAADDPYFPSYTAYEKALLKRKLSLEAHVYPEGGHGFGSRPCGKATDNWLELYTNWLKRI